MIGDISPDSPPSFLKGITSIAPRSPFRAAIIFFFKTWLRFGSSLFVPRVRLQVLGLSESGNLASSLHPVSGRPKASLVAAAPKSRRPSSGIRAQQPARPGGEPPSSRPRLGRRGCRSWPRPAPLQAGALHALTLSRAPLSRAPAMPCRYQPAPGAHEGQTAQHLP